jgi:biopolymer transport protein TolR
VSEWRRKSPKEVVQPDMNVTPLVDVVLVLLIIFMVVAPRMDQDVQVELPGIFNPDPETKVQVDPLKLSVAKKGEYYINEQKYDLDTAIDMLSAEHAADPYRRLVLRADSRLTYGDVRDILARAQKVGFPGMALMVGERHKAGAPATGEATAQADAAASGSEG